MGKSEKLVVLGVLFFVVLLFVWSVQGDGDPSQQQGYGVQASERDPITAPRMDGRSLRNEKQGAESAPSTPQESKRVDERSMKQASLNESEVALGSGSLGSGVLGTGAKVPTRMLLAETRMDGSAASIEVDSSASRRKSGEPLAQGSSRLADPAAGTRSATNRSGVSRARVWMQPGWDLITTAGLQGTVDPSMFLYEVSKAEATWESVAKDLYGDSAKASLLRHNNESMDVPTGPVFVPAKDELGVAGSVRNVEVLQGESLWQVAKRTLGKGSEWKTVWEANRDVIPDPDFVAPGTVLRIPVR